MKKTRQLSMVEQLVQDMVDAGQSDIFAGSLKSLKEMDKAIKAQKELTDSLLEAGDNKALRVLAKEAIAQQQEQVAAVENLIEARTELAKIDREQNQEAYEAQMANIRELGEHIGDLADQSNELQASATKFGKDMKHGLDQYERLLTQREERFKELGERGTKFEEGFAKRFSASVDAFTGGISDLDGVGNTLSSALSSFGEYLSTKQGEKAAFAKTLENEGESKAASNAAEMLGSFSKIAGTLAVVGGSIMMLVKLFQFVEGTVIDANKKLLEGTGIIDIMAAGSGDVSKNLQKVRDTFRDPEFASAMGITLEDTMDLVTSFEKLNFGIKQFGGGQKGMENMKEAMKVARGQAYALGISMDEASEHMANFAFNLGLSAEDGAVVSRMADQFANIRDMALQSSYQTANFFKKVNELTGSLDNMNYRTEEAGSLMIRFSKVLGKSGLDAALQALFSGFRGEGYLDQLKRNMLTKSEELQKATKVEAIRFGQTFLKVFGTGKEGEVGGQVESLLKAVGGGALKDVQEAENKGKKLMEVIGGLDQGKREAVMAKLMKDKSVSDEMRAELYKFMRISRGARKGATQAEKLGAQEEMGAMGNLRSTAALISSVIGDKSINKLGVVDKAALEQYGVSKEQLEIFAQLQTGFKGQFKEAQAIMKDKGLTDEDKKAKIKEMNAGLAINKEGQLVMKDTGEAVKNFNDFLQAQGDKLESQFEIKGPKTQEQYLDEGVKATTSVFNVLNNTIAGILNDISSGIYGILTWFGSENEDEKEAKQQAAAQLSESYAIAQQERKAQEEKVREEEKRLNAKGFQKMNAAQKDKYKEEQKALEEQKKVLAEKRAGEDRTKAMLHEVQKGNFAAMINDNEMDDVLRLASERVLGRREKLGTETGKLGQAQKRKAELEGLQDVIGGSEFTDLLDYVQGKTRTGEAVDDKVLKFMASKGYAFKESESGQAGRSGYKRTAQIVDKEGNVLGGRTTEQTSAPDFDGVMGVETNMTSSTQEEKLRKETMAQLQREATPAQRAKLALESAKATEKIDVEKQKKAYMEATKETKEEELKAVASALGLKEGVSAEKIAQNYLGRDEVGRAAANRKLQGLSLGGNVAAQQLIGQPTNDILITNDGQVWKLNEKDSLTSMGGGGYAMSKPGGAIDDYVGKRMGGGMGGGITINVNGAQNPEEVGRVVMRHIKEYQASFMGSVK